METNRPLPTTVEIFEKHSKKPDDYYNNLSFSRMKTYDSCPRKYHSRYNLKLEQVMEGNMDHLHSGNVSHHCADEWYNTTYNPNWVKLTHLNFYKGLHHFLWKTAKLDPEYPGPVPILTLCLKNFAVFETNRFFRIAKMVPEDQIPMYFFPVYAENKFYDDRLAKGFTFIVDAVFRLVPKPGWTEPHFLVLDFKAGGSAPANIRTNDRLQVHCYTKRLLDLGLLQGVVDNVSIFYLAKESPDFVAYEPKYIAKVDKLEKDTRFGIAVETWTPKWGSRECFFNYYDKISKVDRTVKCEYYKYCHELSEKGELYEEQ